MTINYLDEIALQFQNSELSAQNSEGTEKKGRGKRQGAENSKGEMDGVTEFRE